MPLHTVQSASVTYVIERFRAGDLSVPELQRHERAWDQDPALRPRLIESMLMGLPIPPIWVTGSLEDGIITDGLQRVTTADLFLSDQFRLRHLEELPEFNGLKYSQLPAEQRSRIRSYPLCYFAVSLDTPYGERISLLVFERVNSGLSLSAMEATDGQNLGPGRDLIHRLADHLGEHIPAAAWRQHQLRRSDRAYAVQAIMGLCSQLDEAQGWTVLEKPMKNCGNNPFGTLREVVYRALNQWSSHELDALEYKFRAACERLSEVFGERFLCRAQGKTRSINNTACILQFYLYQIAKEAPIDRMREAFAKVDDCVRPERLAIERACARMRETLLGSSQEPLRVMGLR